MELEKLITLLLIPTGVLTALMQAVKTIPVVAKYSILTVLIAIILGPVVVWLFADLVNMGDVTLKMECALGVLVGLSSVGLFELGKKIPVVNSVVK